MKTKLTALSLAVSILVACNNNKPESDMTAIPKLENKEYDLSKELNDAIDSASNKNTQVRNDIQLETKGVKLSQAYLAYADGNLVPSSNQTSVNRAVKAHLVVQEGWKETNGKVSLGASERIETNTGKVVLDVEDLFKDYATLNAEDAHFIALTANISSLDKPIDYFVVSFRVWDKNGPGEIQGSYRLYVK